MIFRSIVSLLQTIFIPGYIVFNLFKIKTNIVRKFIFIFSLSLISNYLIVFFLTSISLYKAKVIYGIILIELLYLIFLKRKKNKQQKNSIKIQNLNNFWKKQIPNKKIALIIALTSTLWVFFIFIKNAIFFNVFIRWDAIVSWNRWALDWYSNILPQQTMHYPQLIPANWSISYIILGQPIQFIPKTIMPLFTLFILLLFWDLGINKKNYGYIWAIPATTLFIRHAMGETIESGLIDLPVAFMTFCSIASILFAQEITNINLTKKYLILGSIISAGALVTKQAGIIIVIIYPILMFTLIKQLKTKKKIKILIIHLINILVIASPFYIYKKIQIMNNLDGSEINTVTNTIYKGSTLIQRFIYSIKIFLSYNIVFLGEHAVIKNKSLHIFTGSILGILYSILIWFSLKNKTFKLLFFSMFLPYSIFWALFLCYDFRNYAIAIPLYGLSLGLGINYLIKKLWEKKFNIKIIKVKPIIILVATIGLLYLNSKTSSIELLKKQNNEILKIGKYKLNKKLKQYNSKKTIHGNIMTNYARIDQTLFPKKVKCITQNFNISYCGYQGRKQTTKKLFLEYKNKLKNNKIDYILYPTNNTANEINAHINKKLQTNKFERIFEKENYCFLRVKNESK